MKLKEKLSKEFSKNIADHRKDLFPLLNPAQFENDRVTMEQGYLAGFEKAREMAHKIAIDEGSDYGRCWDSDLILKIGEQDIPEQK